ncbi:electron transfer flavoprotein subunit beta [Thiocapsa imhoffii]|uniref:Electron transfer flavoprotein subunit beta n=1 Tax=Thiocapsa imhoffii TaxID=382777 RepID=A0A9X0WJU5_9GAMM|nr:electron transfer flavoprotein subunit beta/FixA family protein [Thiocapsa imhoffii]MBK1646051.1 electron transfer flavoprotein subunit beta [Thiocapsa imhoffii]
MHTIVAIKQVPDTTHVRIDPETGTLIREGVPAVINPYDRHALEMAIRLKERFGGTVTVLTMGPPKAAEALVECVEQGADRAILLSDRKFGGADTLATAYVIAHAIAAIQVEDPADLLLFGKQAIDGDTAQVGPGVATRLAVPLITYAMRIESLDPATRTAIIHRRIEQGIEVLETTLPALLTVEKEIATIARAPLPNLVRAAHYRPETWDATTPVPFDPARIGIKGSATIVSKAFTPPRKEPGERMSVAESGLTRVVGQALQRLVTAGVLSSAPATAPRDESNA